MAADREGEARAEPCSVRSPTRERKTTASRKRQRPERTKRRRSRVVSTRNCSPAVGRSCFPPRPSPPFPPLSPSDRTPRLALPPQADRVHDYEYRHAHTAYYSRNT